MFVNVSSSTGRYAQLAGLAASARSVSDVRLTGRYRNRVASTKLVLNPTFKELEEADMDIMVGTVEITS